MARRRSSIAFCGVFNNVNSNDRSVSLGAVLSRFWRNRELVAVLVQREVLGRYRGSVMGVMWSFFNPILMLAVYTFVFSVVFKARWNVTSESKTEFALVLFAGLIAYGIFSECLNRAPTLIVSNPNYVKKIVFPLEVLPVVSMGAALFHGLVSTVVWFIFYFIFFGVPPVTALLLPMVFLPLILLTLGLSWLLASLGVYLRDVSQVVTVITGVLMFMSPVFYPISALPPEFQGALLMNPLTASIEMLRDVIYWGRIPDIETYLGNLALGAIFAWFGFVWFQKTRKGFADVL